MSIFMTLRIALKALNRNKLRTVLTMLGMIIGVGAVITMVALGTGARTTIEDRVIRPALAGDMPVARAVDAIASARTAASGSHVVIPYALLPNLPFWLLMRPAKGLSVPFLSMRSPLRTSGELVSCMPVTT